MTIGVSSRSEMGGNLDHLAGQASLTERRGEWEQARNLYARVFDAAVGQEKLDRAMWAARALSRICRTQQCFEEAEELAALARVVGERSGLAVAAAQATNMLATIHHMRGELDTAEQLYFEALDAARETRDEELVGSACQNLGILFNTRGDLRSARALYLESIAAAVRAGNRATTMMAYNNLGMASSDLQEWMEAEIYLSRGIEIAEQIGDLRAAASLYTNRAEPQIRVGDLGQASASLDRAETIAQDLGTPDLTDIARWRGVVARKQRDLSGAERHMARALLIAAKAGLTLERAEALEELARLRWQQERHEEAIATAHEALRGFQTLGAKHDIQRVRGLLADWETAELVADWQAGS